MSRSTTLAVILFTLTACGPDDTGSGTDASASSTASATGMASTDAGSTAPTTGASSTTDSTTGEPGGCAPSDGPVPLEVFAQTFAEAVCAQKEACGCEVDFGCVGVLTQSFQAVADFAATNAMHYDAECAGHTLAATVTSRGCALFSEFDTVFERSCWNECTIFRGDVAIGAACDGKAQFPFVLFLNVCADPAALCDYATGTCQVPDLVVVQEGEDCFSPMDGVLGSCAEPTICSVATGKCVVPATAGESCAGGVPCEDELWCDAQDVCQPELPAGTGCTELSQCASLLCQGDVCEDPIAVCAFDDYRDLFFSPALSF